MSTISQIPQGHINIDEVYSTDGIESLNGLSTVSTGEYRLDLKGIQDSNTSQTDDALALPQQTYYMLSAARKLTIANGDHGQCPKILPFFTNVTTFTIQGWRFQEYDTRKIKDLLSHFGTTVTTLELLGCYANSEVLIFLTTLFPHVKSLRVEPWTPDGATFMIQHYDRPLGGAKFQGKLTFSSLGAKHEAFLAFVNEHSLVVHSIEIFQCENKGELQRLFERQGGTLTSVGIYSSSSEDFVSLSPCINLQTLSIRLVLDFESADAHWNLLDHVTSHCLQEIEVEFSCICKRNESLVRWEKVDSLLCQFYDRSHNKGVEFHVSLRPIFKQSEDIYELLMEQAKAAWPEFCTRGEGVVTVVRPPRN